MKNVHFEENPILLSEELIERAKNLNTTLLSDAMGCTGGMDYKIKPVSSNMVVVGTAMTVKVRAGDNLFLHQAISNGKQGYVLVVDGQGHTTNAYIGELMAEAAKVKGLEGVIIDGLVRDRNALIELNFPVFAKGFSPNGPYKDGPGELNIPISCGGVAVVPGDLVVGDADGVVNIPRNMVEKVLALAEEKLVYEEKRKLEIRGGDVEPKWLKSKMDKFVYSEQEGN